MKPKGAALLLAFLAMLFGISWAPASLAATSNGWIRFGNLSHQVNAVDIYLQPSASGAPGQQLVASDVTYGTVLNEMTVPTGTYTVSLRTAGTSASSAPVGSLSVKVQAGIFYTVAPLEVAGQGSQRHVDVKSLPDSTNSASGDGFVQAIDASSEHGKVTFHCSCAAGAPGNILTDASAGTVKTASIPAGPWTMTARTTGAKSSVFVPVAANTDRTEIVIDTSSGVQVLNLLDTVAGAAAVGGVGAGLGGTAPHGPGSPLPWVALIAVGALVTAGGGLWLSRGRGRRLVARG
jgi:hypothetical protein